MKTQHCRDKPGFVALMSFPSKAPLLVCQQPAVLCALTTNAKWMALLKMWRYTSAELHPLENTENRDLSFELVYFGGGVLTLQELWRSFRCSNSVVQSIIWLDRVHVSECVEGAAGRRRTNLLKWLLQCNPLETFRGGACHLRCQGTSRSCGEVVLTAQHLHVCQTL